MNEVFLEQNGENEKKPTIAPDTIAQFKTLDEKKAKKEEIRMQNL